MGLYTSDVRVMCIGVGGGVGGLVYIGCEGDVFGAGGEGGGGLIYLDVSDDGVCVRVCVGARRYVDVGVGGLTQPHAHVDVSVWVSMWVSVWVSMWVSVSVCVSVWMLVWVSVWMLVWVSV